MGFIANLLAEKRSMPFGLRGESPWVIYDYYGQKTNAGANVNEMVSLGVPAVWACVKILANTMASLPLITYKRLDPRGKERAPSHPNYKLLHNRPNPLQTSYEFRHLLSVHQHLWGAGFAEIEFKGGKPVALWPIPPWRVKPKMNEKTGSLWYEIDMLTIDGKKRKIPAYQALVFPSLQCSMLEWISPITVHRETVGYALAVQEFGAKTFGQGTNPSGILTHPGRLKEQSEKDLREKFKEAYEGLSRSHRLMLLEEGMKFERIGLPPADAQYLEARKYTVSDIARIYNVPLHLLQDHEKTTSWGTGIEEMNLGFIAFTMRPLLVQWEQEIQTKLFDDDDEYFSEFLIEGMLRGKQAERYTAYATGRQWGWLSVDDIREIENMNPLPEEQGQVYLTPLNMADVKRIDEIELKKTVEPKEPGGKEPKEGENGDNT